MYRNKAEFLLVYIREAHPDSVLYTFQDGKEVLTKIGQTYTLAERSKAAHQCVATLKLTMPAVVDKEDNEVNKLYAAWPDRLMIVGIDGKLAYKGGPGPGGFKVYEVEQWLKANAK
jgi:type I thyroxine 5'-deiodinase